MPERTPWAEAVAPARERFGPLIAAACRWHEERGCGSGPDADPDVLALLCVGALGLDEDGPESDLAPLLWTRTGVHRLLWAGVPNWCNLHATTTWPLELVPATWHWLDFLHHTGRLDPRSDPLWELRKPLICYGGLDFDGRWRPETDASPIPCECHLPYRETVDYLNGWLENGPLYNEPLLAHGADDPESAGNAAKVGRRWTSERRGSDSRADPRARPTGRVAPRARTSPRPRWTRPSRSDPG